MSTPRKDAALKVILVFIAAVAVSLTMLIPLVLIYKLAHGASMILCSVIFAGYAATWLAIAVLLARFRKRSTIWGVCFGFCFFGLLFLSFKL